MAGGRRGPSCWRRSAANHPGGGYIIRPTYFRNGYGTATPGTGRGGEAALPTSLPTRVTSVRASVAGVRRWAIWPIFENGCGMSRRPTASAHARGWRPLGQLDLIPLGGLVLGTHTQHSRYTTEIVSLSRLASPDSLLPWARTAEHRSRRSPNAKLACHRFHGGDRIRTIGECTAKCRRYHLSVVRQLRRQMGFIELRVCFPQAVPCDPRRQRWHFRPEPILSTLSTAADVCAAHPAMMS